MLRKAWQWWRILWKLRRAGCSQKEARLLIEVAKEQARWSSLSALDWGHTIARDVSGESHVRRLWIEEGQKAIDLNPEKRTWKSAR